MLLFVCKYIHIVNIVNTVLILHILCLSSSNVCLILATTIISCHYFVCVLVLLLLMRFWILVHRMKCAE